MVQQARSSTATQPAQQPIQVEQSQLKNQAESSRLCMMLTYFTLVSCSCLGSPPVFQGLIRLRRLWFGGPALEELKRGDLSGVTELEELTVHANNLMRFGSDAVFVSEVCMCQILKALTTANCFISPSLSTFQLQCLWLFKPTGSWWRHKTVKPCRLWVLFLKGVGV